MGNTTRGTRCASVSRGQGQDGPRRACKRCSEPRTRLPAPSWRWMEERVGSPSHGRGQRFDTSRAHPAKPQVRAGFRYKRSRLLPLPPVPGTHMGRTPGTVPVDRERDRGVPGTDRYPLHLGPRGDPQRHGRMPRTWTRSPVRPGGCRGRDERSPPEPVRVEVVTTGCRKHDLRPGLARQVVGPLATEEHRHADSVAQPTSCEPCSAVTSRRWSSARSGQRRGARRRRAMARHPRDASRHHLSGSQGHVTDETRADSSRRHERGRMVGGARSFSRPRRGTPHGAEGRR
jgi:hypothetical protein